MDYFRPAAERGNVNLGWLNSNHSFSFGHYHDPRHMGFSVLRVINDDTVTPGAGFGTHGHRDMEIISYVLDGVIEHQDSMGNTYRVPAGEVQRMTAGTGVTHSEYNGSQTAPLRFLQIWIVPNRGGLAPGYEQKAIDQVAPLTPLVTADGRAGSLRMHQDASLYRLRLGRGDTETLTLVGRAGYLHMVDGSVRIAGQSLHAGDGAGFQRSTALKVVADSDTIEALWFDLPAVA